MVASSSISPRNPRRRCSAIPVRIAEGAEQQDLLGTSLTLARTQLLSQLADEAGVDARTMGTLGFTGVLLALDIAVKDLLGSAWWIPLVPLALAAATCLSSVLGVGFGLSVPTQFGPDPRALYTNFGHRPLKAAREQLLTDLADARGRNNRRIRAKQRALRASLLILGLGLVLSTAIIGTNPHTANGVTNARQPSIS